MTDLTAYRAKLTSQRDDFREGVADLEAQIARLEAQRDIAGAQAETLDYALSSLPADAGEGAPPPTPVRQPVARATRVKLEDKIMAFLCLGAAAFTIEEVISAFPTTNLVTLKNAMARLVKAERLVFGGRLYGLPGDTPPLTPPGSAQREAGDVGAGA